MILFRYFEKLVSPYPNTAPPPLPQGFFPFLWACARGVRAVFDDSAKGRWYVATVGHDLAGSLLVTPEWSDWFDGTIWWIQSVYVLPVHRGRRLYSGLYGFVKALASIEPSVRGLRLYVDKRNEKAQKVYAALGMNGEHYALFEWMKT